MARRYCLDKKIEALNLIERHDGDTALASDALEIPARTLRVWQRQEATLRQQYNQRQRRRRERLSADLQLALLERSQAILAQMDTERLAKAPLNQLATALGSLVNQALKLEEATSEIDEGEEQVIRFEYFYDGQVQDAPPWAGASAGEPRAFQGGRLRPALGQDRAGQNGAARDCVGAGQTRLVASADLSDGEPSLAGFESERDRAGWHRHPRERAAD